jgi:hypothetical protein
MREESHGGMILRGKNRKTREKTLSQCHFVFVVIIIVRQLVIPYPLVIVIIIIISGSTVLVRTLAASHWRFCNLIKTLGRTPLNE